MGLEIDQEGFEESDYEAFAERLDRSLEALRELLERPGFGEGERTLGAELELFLVDAAGLPLPLNLAVLRETVDPRLTFELDRFNLECNLRWSPLAGRPFEALERETLEVLDEVRRAAGRHAGRVAMIGILPTLREPDLQRSAMTDVPRYRALSAGLQRLRRKPFSVSIEGPERLDITCDDVTFEGANTSLQLHLRVAPADFRRVFNAVQLASGPALAVAGNSPTFLGRQLWEETRVALFKQAVDDRSERGGKLPRVGFGSGWVKEGAFELFAENVAGFEPLLPILGDEDPIESVRAGAVPALDEIRLHQGTVWSWNRAIYDPEGEGHLRIEMRSLPAGPTVLDMLANAAFQIGLSLALADDADDWIRELPFALVEHNFYRAAQSGMQAELAWPTAPGEPASPTRAAQLVQSLLPVARRGLETAGVDTEECDRLLGIIAARLGTGRTGSRWQRLCVARLEPRLGRERALSEMLERYLALSEEERPIHEWPMEEPAGPIRVSLAPRGDDVPETVEEFLRELGRPAFLRVAGRDRSRTRAVSTLLHGNEPSGIRAVHAWLREGSVPAVDTVIFIGAVAAALEPPGFGHRRLPGDRDLNRCFLPPHVGPEGGVAEFALQLLRGAQPEALVDLHNNTGHSPAYGVAPRNEPLERAIASLFGSRYVHSDLRLGALVEATESDCPSVTIECGTAGSPVADAVALAGLRRFLGAEDLGSEGDSDALLVVRDPVRVEVRPGVSLAVGTEPVADVDLTLDAEVDRHNFERLEPGTPIGWVRDGAAWPVLAVGADGEDASRELLELVDGRLRLRRASIPIMMTTDPRAALADCLFYVVAEAET